MACLICLGPTTETPLGRSGKTIECIHCGTYGISGAAIQQMNVHIRLMNSQLALDWLLEHREFHDETPVIEADTPVWN